MNHNKEAKNLTFWRGSEVSQEVAGDNDTPMALAPWVLKAFIKVVFAVRGLWEFRGFYGMQGLVSAFLG